MKIRLLLVLYFLSSVNGFSQVKIFQSNNTPATRFGLPAGYVRVDMPERSFGAYLRRLPLKPWGSSVHYFDGKIKDKKNVYVSVVDLPIGQKDLHQCADAVMRLRAEYLYEQKNYNQIHFNFLVDGKPQYFTTFAKGKYDETTFWKYMEYIFASANTRSLWHELKPVAWQNMQIGDVLIQKGVPFGHAVIVIDMAVNPETGKKIFMLAQSYMPAQEIQILGNFSHPQINPWYELNHQTIYTPEWTFEPTDLRRFP